MSVDRLSVTVPSEMGASLRALASARRTTVSTIVTDAIAHEIRLAALDRALAEADRTFGALAETAIREAEAVLVGAARQALPRRRSSRR
jgi:predicted transcriptional regulator